MASRLKLALIALAILVAPAHANGSMGIDVKVIKVHRPDRAEQLYRETKKARAKEAESRAKAEAKSKAAADKAYAKRLKDRKAKK